MKDHVSRSTYATNVQGTMPSQDVMQHVVWPIIAPSIGGGRYVPVEAKANETDCLRLLLDRVACIDGFQVWESEAAVPGFVGWDLDDGGRKRLVRSISHRILYRPMRAFTLRTKRESCAPVEFDKLKSAVQQGSGWMYPAVTIGAVVDKPNMMLVAAAAVATKSLIEYVIRYCNDPERVQRRTNRNEVGEVEYVKIEWDRLKMDGVTLKMWSSDDAFKPSV